MSKHLQPIYRWGERWSRVAVLTTLALLLILKIFISEINLSLQLVIALIALLIGIPHGAIDHLISIPAHPRRRFFAFILIYIIIAVAAGWFIATWNVLGFQCVVVMSALHFGYGDASFRNEENDAKTRERNSFPTESAYALPAGFIPVVLPLTDHRTLSALTRIHPALQDWAGRWVDTLRLVTLASAAVGLLALLVAKKFSLCIDLILLTALALIAPPLIAFATYFGLWHALRHTARLVSKLPTADGLARAGNWKGAIRGAITPGLYAIVGTFAIATILMVRSPGRFSSSLLWSTLVTIWALTVPHMATTARFDWKALHK
jgi:Brp/Blh family beta-carotene 15,15'-monooxygenase